MEKWKITDEYGGYKRLASSVLSRAVIAAIRWDRHMREEGIPCAKAIAGRKCEICDGGDPREFLFILTPWHEIVDRNPEKFRALFEDPDQLATAVEGG